MFLPLSFPALLATHFGVGINIVLAVLMAFLAIAYEGRLINRIQKLEREIDDLKRRMTYGS